MRALLTVSCIVLALQGRTAMAEPGSPCSSGLFGVAAQIVKIEPTGATVDVRQNNIRTRTIRQDGLVCLGETLHIPEHGAVKKVELYVPGEKRLLLPGSSFETRQGPLRFVAQALLWLSDAFPQSGLISPTPDISLPTAGRGRQSAILGSEVQIHAMRLLDHLPEQSIAVGVQPVLSWRDGTAPYHCEAFSALGDNMWTGPLTHTSWCAVAPHLDGATQLIVKDSIDQVVAWNIRSVEWADVPKPDWLRLHETTLSPQDKVAWALWLWKQPDDAWRLQALGMLDSLTNEAWIAAYIRANLLSENENLKR